MGMIKAINDLGDKRLQATVDDVSILLNSTGDNIRVITTKQVREYLKKQNISLGVETNNL
jgi:uncharacterized protein